MEVDAARHRAATNAYNYAFSIVINSFIQTVKIFSYLYIGDMLQNLTVQAMKTNS